MKVVLVTSGTKYRVGCGEGVGGIKSRVGQSFAPRYLITGGFRRLSRIGDMGWKEAGGVLSGGAYKKRRGTKGGVQHEDFPGGHPS